MNTDVLFFVQLCKVSTLLLRTKVTIFPIILEQRYIYVYIYIYIWIQWKIYQTMIANIFASNLQISASKLPSTYCEIKGSRAKTLQWRHNGEDSVSNHQPHDCLLNRLFRRKDDVKAPRHRGPVNSPHKWPVTRKMFPFDDVIMGVALISMVSQVPVKTLAVGWKAVVLNVVTCGWLLCCVGKPRGFLLKGFIHQIHITGLLREELWKRYVYVTLL